MSTDPTDVTFGTDVYDEAGNRLGTVRGFDEHGFYVSTDDGMAALSSEHLASGIAGEAELMWRCWSCGEMGQIEQLPEECPSCGAPKEDIYYWKSD
ncbi:MAG: rubredoxin-like domain-containing protein [Halorhabdus sp.]